MPSRILRDRYATSQDVASCSPAAQDRLPRYWLAADDLGCFDAHPPVLLGRLFALRPDMTPAKVASDLREYARAGMLELYQGRGGPWGFWRAWHRHQRPRPQAVARAPIPPSVSSVGGFAAYISADFPRESAASCGDLPQLAASRARTAAAAAAAAAAVSSLQANVEEQHDRHAEDGVTFPVSATTAESAGTEETAEAHANPTQNAAARSGSAGGPTPQATPTNAASATTAPGNGESGRAPGLPGIDPGPARGAAAKRRESAASEQRVFAAWQEAMGRPDSVLDAARRRRIAWAVREYGEARAVAAIRGCAATPWNMGENKERKRWDDLTLIFRDATHAERFMATHDARGGQLSAREKAAAIARELRASGDAAE